MNKRVIASAIAAALLGGGLVWAADHEKDHGIAGWETLNTSMAQALGAAETVETAPLAGGISVDAKEGTDNDKQVAASKSTGSENTQVGVAAAKTGSTSTEAAEAEDAGSAATAEFVAEGGRHTAAESVAEDGGHTAASEAGDAGGNEAGKAAQAASPAAAEGGAIAGAGGTNSAAALAEGKINVNTAAAGELMNLPGIGEKKAQAIIDYRSSKGAFRSLEDLGEVKGIGPKMLDKLKPLVVF